MRVCAGVPATCGLEASAREWGVTRVVVGLPLNMDGTEGKQAKLARAFAADLAEKTDLDVRLWDETLSSFEADQKLRGRLTRKQKRRRHDALAAAAFLEDFFSCAGERTAPRPDELEH